MSHHKLRSRAPDHDAMRQRMDAIRLKQILGEPLTEREVMLLQFEQSGMGCRVCHHPDPGSRATGG